jgi:flagellar motor protein MotB
VKYEYSEANMTKTMSELAIFMDMISKGFPVNPETVIDKLDLPETEKTKWKEYVKQGQESQQKMAQAQQQMAQQQMMMDMQEKQAGMQEKQHKLALENQKMQGTLALKNKELEYRRMIETGEWQVRKQISDDELTVKKTIADEDRRVDLAELEIKRDDIKDKGRVERARAVTEIRAKETTDSREIV